jgi:hypothetical protein
MCACRETLSLHLPISGLFLISGVPEVVPMLQLGGLLVKVGIQVKEFDHLKVDVIRFRLLVHRGEAEEPLIGQGPVFLP